MACASPPTLETHLEGKVIGFWETQALSPVGEIECCSHGLAVNGKWKLFVLVVPGGGTQLVIQHPRYWHRHRHVV